jgi:hypothetical protein
MSALKISIKDITARHKLLLSSFLLIAHQRRSKDNGGMAEIF